MLFKNIKYKKLGKRMLFSLALIAPTPLVGLVVACGNDNDEVNVNYNSYGKWIKHLEDLNRNQIFRVRLTKWIDGDTANFKYYDTDTKSWVSIAPGGKPLSLRIASIDTPELHVPSGDGKDHTGIGDLKPTELKWAQKAQVWAAKEVPLYTTENNYEVRVWKIGHDSYARWTGSIFYGEHYEKNFSVNIIRSGLTFPRVDNVAEAVTDRESPLGILAYGLYEGWLDAKRHNRGLFSLSHDMLEKAYKKHGIPGNELPTLMKKLGVKKFSEGGAYDTYDIYKFNTVEEKNGK